jgi:hypothetical protein
MVLPVWDPALFMDAFCERRSPSLWDEPLNLATNLALIVAAGLLVRRAAQLRGEGAQVPPSVQALIALIAAMALSSAAYHMAATRWAGVSDAMAVRVFALYFSVCFMRWMIGWPWSRVLLVLPLFAALGLLVPQSFVPTRGLLTFVATPLLPGLLGLVLFSTVLALRNDAAWKAIAAAAAAFGVALVCHRADRALCEAVPTGTHFLWHVFSAVTVYLITRAVLERAVQRLRPMPVPVPVPVPMPVARPATIAVLRAAE